MSYRVTKREFGHAEPVTRAQQTVTSPTFPGQLVALCTLGSSSTDETGGAVVTV